VALGFTSAHAESIWLTDFHRAQDEAKTSQVAFLNFTGSDWCGWCKRLDAEVFSKPEFAEYAKQNLVLMTVDFPRAKTAGAARSGSKTQPLRRNMQSRVSRHG
jgi:protein disulfide-isomerase